MAVDDILAPTGGCNQVVLEIALVAPNPASDVLNQRGTSNKSLLEIPLPAGGGGGIPPLNQSVVGP